MEATGELVTGALVAGAIERNSGERRPEGHAHGLCLNCGTALVGDYCHRCGQAEHIHRSLSAIWHDIAHGVLHFEGKVWNTLPLLAWRPGELTRRFVHGERARFVSPMALFLFSVFLMFALFSAIGAHLEVPGTKNAQGTTAVQVNLQRREAKAELARIDKEIAARLARGEDAGDLKRERATVAGVLRFLDGGPTVLANAPKEKFNLHTGWPALDKGLEKASENPNLILYKLQSNAYKFSWALIPISTPFVWLLFAWKRRFRMYDHAVFVTYSLAFMSLLVIALTLLGRLGVGSTLITFAVLLIPPLHIYKQLRGAYDVGRMSALVRTSLLLVFAFWALVAYLLLLLALGVLG